MTNVTIFDCEVSFADWLFVFKIKPQNEYFVFHNDNDGVIEFMRYYEPLLAGFNNKHYDQFILKAVMLGCTPEEIKELNDFIIVQERNGWDHPIMQKGKVWFNQYDLMDDMQMGLSLKAIEAHLGMDIRETTVDFNLRRAWTDKELEEMIFYCKHDVDATDILNDLREKYLQTKIDIGKMVGIPPEKALYMTNAKLTAAFLHAKPPDTPWLDEREYEYPDNLKKEYIPQAVFDFFDRMRDKTIPDSEIFNQKLNISVGGTPTVIGFGGIHAAIPNYYFEEGRSN